MIYLTPKQNKKKIQNNCSFFLASINPMPLPLLLRYIEHFRKQNKRKLLSK